MRRKLAVLTGGPCSGKTTTLEALRQAGYQVLPEAALAVIDELNQSLGMEQQKRWRQGNAIEFQMMVARKQQSLEQNITARPGEWIFLDRSLLDGLAYLRQVNLPPPLELTRMVNGARYDRMFLLDTLGGFDSRLETGRMDTLDFSLQIQCHISDVYTDMGYQAVWIPEMSVANRVQLIVRSLGD